MRLQVGTSRAKINLDSLLRAMLFLYVISFVVLSNWSMEAAAVSHLMGLILAFVFVLTCLVGQLPSISIPIEIRIALVFIMVTLFIGPFSINPEGFIAGHLTIFQLVVFAIIAHNIMLRSDINVAIDALMCGCLIVIVHLIAMGGTDARRIAGLMGNANVFGMTLGFAICLMGYRMTTVSASTKPFLISLILLFGYFMMRSGSRKAVLIVVVVLLVLTLIALLKGLVKGSQRNLLVGVACVIIFTGVLVPLAQTDVMSKRIGNLFQAVLHQNVYVTGEGSLIERWNFVVAGYQIFSNSPLLGVGSNQYRFAVLNYNPSLRETYSHSNYIEVLANHGLVGFVVFYSIYVVMLYKVLKTYGYRLRWPYTFLRDLLLSLMLAIMVLEVGWVSYVSKLYWLLLAIIITGTRMLYSRGIVRV